MKIFISIIFLFVSAVSWVSCVQTLEGSVGGAVDITCGYPDYIVVGSVFLKKLNLKKSVIESKLRVQTFTRGRFSLYHDSTTRLITVTIYNLTREDAGIYSCGAAGYEDRDDYYTEINLEVKHAPPTSKPPLTTGSTSAHSTPTGQTNHGGLVAAVLVTILLVLTVIVIILMKIRAKGKETPQSTQRNRSNSEEENAVYSEIKETDSSADTLQTPPTPSNQSQHQDGLPLTSVYTTVSLCPDLLPASTQAANRNSGTTIEINDTNQNSEIDDTYHLATNPIPPTDLPAAANQNSEIDDTYHLATNPIPPTEMSAANQQLDSD